MQDSLKFFIGIDVSKPYFDASLLSVIGISRHPIQTQRFDNNPDGLKLFQKWLRKNKVTLLKYIQKSGIYKWNLSNLLSFIRMNIFVKIVFWKCANDPFIKDKIPDKNGQFGVF